MDFAARSWAKAGENEKAVFPNFHPLIHPPTTSRSERVQTALGRAPRTINNRKGDCLKEFELGLRPKPRPNGFEGDLSQNECARILPAISLLGPQETPPSVLAAVI